ncbi:hypothetical protein B1748_31105 [Paenibacillus sp. MY03]|uniref:IS66 family insertion sequence element accessory protein TnpB n=1 Tax=Paenibacillus sp. MY03 TaxID=302980 RepID=UPI000B3CD0CD|nr:IS66 family insertion sequence element accessory protein TnpB [Paenibacillus sp. MY03]OUS69614.1 hypothetical protein B1748_31105 [Paenibacillus sp. MY03]
MLKLSSSHPVYLACGSTDLRKSIDGLAAIVQEGFVSLRSLPVCLCSAIANDNKLKILYWEHNGFWLFYRARHQMPCFLNQVNRACRSL